MIGERLRLAGVVTDADLHEALAEHKRCGERLGVVLIRMNLASDRQVAEALAEQLELPFVELSQHSLMPAALLRMSKRAALAHTCIPLALDGNVLTVAMADPLSFAAIQDIEFQSGCRVRQVVATSHDISEAIRREYPDSALTLVAPPSSRGSAASASRRTDPEVSPVVEIVELAISSALNNGASDIHIEPVQSGVVVRHRIDGLLREAMDLPAWMHEGLVARIKVMAGLDIAEKRLPQDGRIRTAVDRGQSIDLRVSTMRTILGEKVVLRVLDHRKGAPPLETLGFSPEALAQIRLFLRHQHGMILAVGPTGSGKTTTLSSALVALRSGRTNIITIEDPVEYQIPGVNQTQINGTIDLTFARSLRAVLRQDPDVVLVGEIRDQETARIAMQAAQTGHLVLSTLHTNDAPSCIERLTDIGVEPYVSAAALVGVVAQRLMRRLCTNCRVEYRPAPAVIRALSLSNGDAEAIRFYRAAGCQQCHETGYHGRVGIYEVLHVTDEIRRVIARKSTGMEVRGAARALGMRTLAEDGLLKVKDGLTSPEELLRVVTNVAEERGACSSCGNVIEPGFVACPGCGHHVGASCVHCGRSMKPGWSYCPYCAEKVVAAGQESRSLTRLRAVR